ncbi:hypothetical protein APASM_5328 [Actinosynnema pretiosum subsp. pretiosum]|nr:hypothetical protein APASM_5328 [Actinosynnema pretiosum subsp. pretiosum]
MMSSRPATIGELLEALGALAGEADRLAESAHVLRCAAARLVGAATAGSVGTAARRAEEAHLELEVALRDVRDALRPLPWTPSKDEDGRPMV